MTDTNRYVVRTQNARYVAAFVAVGGYFAAFIAGQSIESINQFDLEIGILIGLTAWQSYRRALR